MKRNFSLSPFLTGFYFLGLEFLFFWDGLPRVRDAFPWNTLWMSALFHLLVFFLGLLFSSKWIKTLLRHRQFLRICPLPLATVSALLLLQVLCFLSLLDPFRGLSLLPGFSTIRDILYPPAGLQYFLPFFTACLLVHSLAPGRNGPPVKQRLPVFPLLTGLWFAGMMVLFWLFGGRREHPPLEGVPYLTKFLLCFIPLFLLGVLFSFNRWRAALGNRGQLRVRPLNLIAGLTLLVIQLLHCLWVSLRFPLTTVDFFLMALLGHAGGLEFFIPFFTGCFLAGALEPRDRLGRVQGGKTRQNPKGGQERSAHAFVKDLPRMGN